MDESLYPLLFTVSCLVLYYYWREIIVCIIVFALREVMNNAEHYSRFLFGLSFHWFMGMLGIFFGLFLLKYRAIHEIQSGHTKLETDLVTAEAEHNQKIRYFI